MPPGLGSDAHFASSAPTAPGALHRGHRPQLDRVIGVDGGDDDGGPAGLGPHKLGLRRAGQFRSVPLARSMTSVLSQAATDLSATPASMCPVDDP